jgi:hypothetical protein
MDTEYIIRKGKKHNVEIPKEVAEYMLRFTDETGEILDHADIDAWVLRTIATATFTNQLVTMDFVKDLRPPHMEDNQRGVLHIQPRSALEIEAFELLSSRLKNGYKNNKDRDDALSMYFKTLEFLKQERIGKS